MFYLGTHIPSWLGRTTVPLFVSRRTLFPRKTFPRATGRWALDSGGFSELSLYGAWSIDAKTYVEDVRRFSSEIGSMDWAAPMDWMCEPWVLEKTGLSIEEHQRRTIRSVVELRDLAPEIPWVPVLQGWTRDDYLRCGDAYARAGIDLTREPLVGLGTVCRRQGTKDAEQIVHELAVECGVKIHGFGVKTTGLRKFAHKLSSADSLAWSFGARRLQRPALPECEGGTHKNCANCMPYALHWRDGLLKKVNTHALV